MGTRRQEAPAPRPAAAGRAPQRQDGLAPTPGPLVLPLEDARAVDARLTGAKAANLASAAAAGFSVVPGFVLTTRAFDAHDPGWPGAAVPEPVEQALRRAWGAMPEGGALVVRSSSTVEDIGASSMAGQFLSRLGISTWEEFLDAVREVQRSAADPASGGPAAPMAVLVQRQVSAALGGVMFGLDPMTGDESRVLVEVVPGGPEHLVSGTVTAQRYLLGRRGRVVEGPAAGDRAGDGEPAPLLDRRLRRRLARLAQDTARAFGRPQDVEWAVDTQDSLWLLQSRPVTAAGSAVTATGPLLGPGPLGETFPLPLRPLERDLWLVPLRRGIANAITVTGAVPHARVAASPLVLTVGGRVSCDLALIGASPERPSPARLLDPRVGLRRSISAWRVGRLRGVLPELAQDMARRVDGELAAITALDRYSSAELLEIVQRVRSHLASVHGHEVLAGVLLQGGTGATAAGAAMRALARGRELGLADAEIIARWPVVLALTPPRLDADPGLPVGPGGPPGPPSSGAWAAELDKLPPREALRLRARWLQEVSARAVALLAERMAAAERVPDAASVGLLSLEEFSDIVAGWPAPPDLPERDFRPGAPLPSAFRVDERGDPVPVRFGGDHRRGGRGASPGRAEGIVVHDPASGDPGAILVTRTLDPRLALWLPRLGAVVSETGSVLSHLAILAREYQVPTVVGVHDAVDRYAVGERILVDGGTGEISRLDHEPVEVPDVVD